jgi:hypothetical protein
MGVILVGLYLGLVSVAFISCLAWLVLGAPPAQLALGSEVCAYGRLGRMLLLSACDLLEL